MDINCTCSYCGAPMVRRAQSVAANVKRHFCDMSCKSAFQRLAKPVTREWLEKKYVGESMDCVQIGRLVSRDPKSVWNWLKDFGIPRRPRGSNWSQLPAGRPKGFKHSDEAKEKMRWIAKASGRVPYDPAVGSYMKGRKGASTPNWKGGITADRQALYATEEWRSACKDVWNRANAKCERCEKNHNVEEVRGTFHIHHIVSFKNVQLRAEPSNLALLCNECHRFVHGKKNTNREFIKGE